MYLVFDIGGTFTKYAWMDAEGNVKENGKVPTKCKPGDTIQDFEETMTGVYEMFKDRDDFQGVAVGLPGLVDVETGMVYDGGSLRYLHGVNVQELISKCCGGHKVSLENDGKCAALAEVWKGNAMDATNACVLVFGTGVGGGIIINKRVHHGNHMLAGELSWSLMNMTREDLSKVATAEELQTANDIFGRLTFLSTTKCSTAGLVRHVAEAKNLPESEVSGELIYQWTEEGDEIASEMLEDMYFSIAKLCINMHVAIDPDVILIGGGISAQPAFLKGIQKYVDQIKVMTKIYSDIKLDVCKYHNRSNLLGALYNYKLKYEM